MISKPYRLSKGKSKLLQILSRVGLGDAMFWNIMLKQNNALDRMFDKPFVDKLSDGIKYLSIMNRLFLFYEGLF